MRLHEFIAENRPRITQAWKAAVLQLPLADRLPEPALTDHLPEFLGDLANWLESDGPLHANVFRSFAAEHAEHRLGHSIDLHQVAVEYRFLRRVILELFPAAPEAVENVRFNEALDHAVAQVVEQYTRAKDATRERFISILAHDLRSPLGVVAFAAATLVDRGGLDDRQLRTLERITRSVARMERMVTSLLDLARTSLGSGLPVHPVSMNMGKVVRLVVEELTSLYPARHVEYECSGELDGRWDVNLVTQAVTNVVVNAVEHGEDPTRVFVAEVEGGVSVEVMNCGPPIPPSIQKTLFEPFARAGAGSSGGLGLGLYITCEVLRAHGGHIRVRSSAAEGTVFSMRWPRSAKAVTQASS